MITIKDFMEVIDYKITEGSPYLWNCFGSNAFRIDCWTGALEDKDQEGPDFSLGMIFDTVQQTVYQVEAHDYKNERSYRWTNPDFIAEYQKEVELKLKDKNNDVAYDNVKFIDIDVEEDFLTKAKAIVKDKPYDTRLQVPIDLEDSEIFELMKMAHERDITLNQLVEQAISAVINKETSNAK